MQTTASALIAVFNIRPFKMDWNSLNALHMVDLALCNLYYKHKYVPHHARLAALCQSPNANSLVAVTSKKQIKASSHWRESDK